MKNRSASIIPRPRAGSSRRGLAAAWLLTAWCSAAGAAITAPDTLAKVAQRGTLTFGVRQSSAPFSSIPQGSDRAEGYSIDLCDRIAAAIRLRLHLPALQVRHVAVTPADRIERLENGDIDLECGSTTNTRARQQRVAFSYTTFLTGTRLLTRRNAGIDQVRDLVGKTVVTTRGTSTESLLKLESEIGWMRGVRLLSATDHPEAFRMVVNGEAAAFAMDDILLSALLAKTEKPQDLAIVGSYLSIEPYALMYRKDDPAFAAVVNDTLRALMQSGEILDIYKKWLMNAAFNHPPTQLIRESFAAPDTTPAFP